MTDLEKRFQKAAFEWPAYKEKISVYGMGVMRSAYLQGALFGYAQAEAEIKRLREALEWYTHDMEVRKIEGKHYICPQKDSDSDGALFYAIGKRARDALKGGE